MESEELININVIIADRPYPLKIKRSEEEGIRNAAKFVNDKVKEFGNVYAAKDKQDYLAMCALMLAVDALKNEERNFVDDPSVNQDIQSLSNQLDDLLGS